ncbi:MAG: HEPN domain-containing protein [Dehalococcoidia bacterium]|nr:HEPN domain-containing protein [Candidatus Omnitrophota bacterium]MDZ4279075.1 HEPN domain-containing protein [Dehalococcoidia bacterium]
MNGQQTLTVRLPFQTPPWQDLEQQGPYEFELGEYRAALQRTFDQVEVTVVGLRSEADAERYFERLVCALRWTAVELRYGILPATELEKVIVLDEPVPEDNPNRIPVGTEAVANYGACIYPDGLKIVFLRVGDARIGVSVEIERMADLLNEGMALAICADGAFDDKLRLAFELYSSLYYERSASARFLAVMMCLEVLKEQRERADELIGMIERWKGEVDEKVRDPREADSLKGGLNRLRRESIGRSIRKLVEELLGDRERAREAESLYDLRSRLVHGEDVSDEVRNGAAQAETLVTDVLKAILLRGRP